MQQKNLVYQGELPLSRMSIFQTFPEKKYNWFFFPEAGKLKYKLFLAGLFIFKRVISNNLYNLLKVAVPWHNWTAAYDGTIIQ